MFLLEMLDRWIRKTSKRLAKLSHTTKALLKLLVCMLSFVPAANYLIAMCAPTSQPISGDLFMRLVVATIVGIVLSMFVCYITEDKE